MSIKPLILICQICGLIPISRSSDQLAWQLKVRWQIVSLVLIIYNSILFFLPLIYSEAFAEENTPKLRIVLSSVLLIVGNIRVWFVLIETYVKRHQQAKLLNLFEELNVMLKREFDIHIAYKKVTKTCRTLIKLFIGLVVSTLIVYSINFLRNRCVCVIRHFGVFWFPFVLGKLCYAYSVILVRLLHAHLDSLSKHLKLLIKPNGYYIRDALPTKSASDDSVSRKQVRSTVDPQTIHFVKKSYSKIWEASLIINKIFYYSFPVAWLSDLVILIFNSWTFCVFLFSSRPNLSLAYLAVHIPMNLANMLYIAHSFQKAVQSVSYVRVLFMISLYI